MNVYLITYDLNSPGQKYDCLYKAIDKAFPDGRKCLNNIFIIKSTKSSAEIRDYLSSCLDKNDKLLVVRLAQGSSRSWATLRLDTECTDWLKSSLS